MTGRRSLILVSLVLGALAAFAASACGQDGRDPPIACPPLSLYNVNAPDAATDPKIVAERLRAVDAGCMTDLDDASVNVLDDAATKP